MSKRKEEELRDLIRSYGSCAVAFSSGVDSTYLMEIASQELGDKAVAITATSNLFPVHETEETVEFCRSREIRHRLFPIDEMKIKGFEDNPVDRCYICKKSLFGKMLEIKEELGVAEILEGSNVDDDKDYRPGSRAIAELGIRSPLKEVGLTKDEVRALSKEIGLSTWDKPSFACLASRIPYGEKITKEKLSMIERGEEVLSDLGFSQYRVRVHMGYGKDKENNVFARIEIEPDEFSRLIEEEMRSVIYEDFRNIGFTYVTMDLAGYRMGSLNEGI